MSEKDGALWAGLGWANGCVLDVCVCVCFVGWCSDEKVAIKILEREKIQGDEDWNRVRREISILQKIRHPHVIQLYEVGTALTSLSIHPSIHPFSLLCVYQILQTHDQLLLIMEYASGGELFDYIVAQRKVKEREACKFFHQILAGVEKIHQLGVVHR